jgi:hypothetical protein
MPAGGSSFAGSGRVEDKDVFCPFFSRKPLPSGLIHHKLRQILRDLVMLLRLTRMYNFPIGRLHAKLKAKGVNQVAK